MTIRMGGCLLVGALMLPGCGSTTTSSAATSNSTTPAAAVEQVTTLYVPKTAKPGSVRQYIEDQMRVGNGRFRECCGDSPDGVERITLRADQEPFAADLVRRFGDRIRVQLGHFAYPLDATSASTCPSADSRRRASDSRRHGDDPLRQRRPTAKRASERSNPARWRATTRRTHSLARGDPLPRGSRRDRDHRQVR
jgi:hypothetical protein